MHKLTGVNLCLTFFCQRPAANSPCPFLALRWPDAWHEMVTVGSIMSSGLFFGGKMILASYRCLWHRHLCHDCLAIQLWWLLFFTCIQQLPYRYHWSWLLTFQYHPSTCHRSCIHYEGYDRDRRLHLLSSDVVMIITFSFDADLRWPEDPLVSFELSLTLTQEPSSWRLQDDSSMHLSLISIMASYISDSYLTTFDSWYSKDDSIPQKLLLLTEMLL